MNKPKQPIKEMFLDKKDRINLGIELVTLLIALTSLGFSIINSKDSDKLEEQVLALQKENLVLNKKAKRDNFQQTLINGFQSHNWKFLEYWENSGVRPNLNEITEMDKREFGKRVVLFDHLYILWQVYLTKESLTYDDLDSYRLWAQNWYPQSKPQMKIIFFDGNGDLFP